MAKGFFTKNDVKYEEHDVAVDEKARDEMVQKSGQFGVPVIDINGEIVVGFDRARISELLGLNK
jgi:glutaredoxin